MNELLKQKIDNLPQNSGVYVMRNISGQVIYVGKAKNLKNRVSQYFGSSKKGQKVENMVSNVYSLEYFITPTEYDALALESNLIKKYQPYYNILLKDGKAFAYIKLNKNQPFPKFEITRKLSKDKCKYFGPYFSGISASEILKIINLAFPLRTCSLKINSNKPKDRPCLNFSLGLCLAPCTNNITKTEYNKILAYAINFLNGDTAQAETILKQKMLTNSQNENFEQALLFRDRLKMIDRLKEKTIANMPKMLELDIFCICNDNINSAISVVVCRGGKIMGIKNYNIVLANQDKSETLSTFILQYYHNTLIPKEILVNVMPNFVDGLQQTLSQQRNSNVKITMAQKGYKTNLIKMCEQNAINHLNTSLTAEKQKFDATIGALQVLQQTLHLSKLPKRMECYDISNISGIDSVASMVVMTNGILTHNQYRRFKIKTVEGPDDFASMKEVLERRLNRLGDEKFGQAPDLIVIDGGKGQLSSAYEILQKYPNANIELISLAKRFEEVYTPNNPSPIMLDRNSKALKLLISLRDETHRFAITFHRKTHIKSSLSSFLDNLDNVGKTRKQYLIKQFKTMDKIKNATVDELSKTPTISLKLAQKIYRQIHNENNDL